MEVVITVVIIAALVGIGILVYDRLGSSTVIPYGPAGPGGPDSPDSDDRI